jgi:hypothetical protein
MRETCDYARIKPKPLLQFCRNHSVTRHEQMFHTFAGVYNTLLYKSTLSCSESSCHNVSLGCYVLFYFYEHIIDIILSKTYHQTKLLVTINKRHFGECVLLLVRKINSYVNWATYTNQIFRNKSIYKRSTRIYSTHVC